MEYVLEVPAKPECFYNLTDKIGKLVKASRVENGLCAVFCRHTTCCIVIQEDDSLLLEDLRKTMNRIAPLLGDYNHQENASSHIRASILGAEKTIPISNGALALGEWQNILLYECDIQERLRKVVVKIV